MKHLKHKAFFMIATCQFMALLYACNPGKEDVTIKKDLESRAKEDRDFAGVRFTVANKIITLDGECATDKSKSTVETTAKGIYSVKAVVNNICIAPVVIGTDWQLKQGVDSVLQDYPAMEAITKDSVVHLQGKLPDSEVLKLKAAINSLKPKTIDAQLTSK